jgi:hypothetical protein
MNAEITAPRRTAMMPPRVLSLRWCARLVVTVILATAAGDALAQNAPQIAPEAQQAVEAMGKTLAAEGFSFRDLTIREYADASGQPLHIFHSATVVVRRPDRLAVDVNGDDGASRIVYDGKQLTLYSAGSNRYATMPATGSIEDVLRMAASKMGMDFPLADLLAEAPGKAFLNGITTGYVVGNVNIRDVPSTHLFFIQPPGIELELWVQSKEPAVPRRLIVTYRSLPGEPRFIAVMGDWKLGLHPPDGEFEFQVPSGATKVEIEKEKP